MAVYTKRKPVPQRACNNNNHHHHAFDLDPTPARRYRHWQGPSSGECAVGALLQPGAFAKRPLGPLRLPRLAADLPLAFVYGATDWMDIGAAHAVASAVGNNKIFLPASFLDITLATIAPRSVILGIYER